MTESDFNQKAASWDQNPIHIERSEAIAVAMREMIPADKSRRALEYGAGTGLLSFLLTDEFSEIILMDSSEEMIRVCKEKTLAYGTKHIRPVLFDLEKEDFNESFDIIYNQMVFHHINDLDKMIDKFKTMLNKDGVLVIADLYPEDGSFHGADVKVHPGFDPEMMSSLITGKGFQNITYKPCFVIKRDGREYPVFIMKAEKR